MNSVQETPVVAEIDVVVDRRDLEDELEIDELDDDMDEDWREETLLEHLARSARENPASAALIGAGLTWMLLGGARTGLVGEAARTVTRTANRTARAVGDAVSATAETAEETVVRAGRTVAGTARAGARTASRAARKTADVAGREASRAEDYAEDAAERAGSAATRAGRETAEGLRGATRAVERGSERALRATEDLAQNRPFLFSTLCLAVGAGAAVLLPRTRKENELLGEPSVRTVQAASRRAASFVASSVRAAQAKTSEAVQEAARKAAEEAAKRVLRQADSIGEAVVDTFDQVSRDLGAGTRKEDHGQSDDRTSRAEGKDRE